MKVTASLEVQRSGKEFVVWFNKQEFCQSCRNESAEGLCELIVFSASESRIGLERYRSLSSRKISSVPLRSIKYFP
jgi:DTW domain-containing protein YfiP